MRAVKIMHETVWPMMVCALYFCFHFFSCYFWKVRKKNMWMQVSKSSNVCFWTTGLGQAVRIHNILFHGFFNERKDRGEKHIGWCFIGPGPDPAPCAVYTWLYLDCVRDMGWHYAVIYIAELIVVIYVNHINHCGWSWGRLKWTYGRSNLA